MRKVWLLLCGILLAILAIGLVRRKAGADRDQKEFLAQLELARKEGLPTTWQEFAATIPTASPNENAAPYYRQLSAMTKTGVIPKSLDDEILFDRTSDHVREAKALLAKEKPVLRLIDDATARPRCWFNRDWSQGGIVVMPELTYMKLAAKLLAIRGSLAAEESRPDQALNDAKKIFTVAHQAGDEGTLMSELLNESIYQIGLRTVAAWAFTHPDVAAYREAFDKALGEAPKPNLKSEHRGDLYEILWVVDRSLTPEGRKDLGIKEEDRQRPSGFVSLLLSQPKSKVEIVRQMRERWKAFDLPRAQRDKRLEETQQKVILALLAFPDAAHLYDDLGFGDDEPTNRENAMMARRQTYLALNRALQERTIPKSIVTRDLLSPFDGKPLSYAFDGKQIRILVSGHGSDDSADRIELKLPPDKTVSTSNNKVKGLPSAMKLGDRSK
ncbi:MAG TPA: hypothetical protein VG944_14430 [Fimbriimonas sp.]|nr:hypothetical protein [Fimbriimonas sp.]